jgi:hypothetical protein
VWTIFLARLVKPRVLNQQEHFMWLFTPLGFFSIVQKPGTSHLTIRARVKGDLEALRAQFLPELSPTLGQAGTDYPWRATATHEDFAAAAARMAMAIDYSNFKDEVAIKQGKARARSYGSVWNVLYDLSER